MASWVVRAIDNPDYGLDDQIEIFEDGEATGLLLYVQARGTDELNLRKALAVRVRAEQQAYFNAVDQPAASALPQLDRAWPPYPVSPSRA